MEKVNKDQNWYPMTKILLSAIICHFKVNKRYFSKWNHKNRHSCYGTDNENFQNELLQQNCNSDVKGRKDTIFKTKWQNGTYIIPQKIQGLRKRKNKHIILHLVHNKSLQDIIVETEIREKKMQRLPYLPFKEKTKLISQRKALTGLNSVLFGISEGHLWPPSSLPRGHLEFLRAINKHETNSTE